jgi:predicted DsbA family dithiol-disulfide isomerase
MAQAKNNDSLVIEITSDYVCPWCYLGEARLEKAIRLAAPKVSIKRSWRPYELNPDQPKEGVDRQEYMIRRFGAEKVQVMQARMKELGKEEGLEFHQELIKRSPNTRQAHRLNWLAEQEGKSLATAIFKAYFSGGKDIGNDEVLTALAAEAGMDKKKVRAFLSSDEGTDEIERMEQEGRARGIEGVPFIVIGSEEIHGAETVEDMTAALERALKSLKAA